MEKWSGASFQVMHHGCNLDQEYITRVSDRGAERAQVIVDSMHERLPDFQFYCFQIVYPHVFIQGMSSWISR
jgi:hypothetical protein